MSTLNVDKVDPSTGTALEIGSSGDTITIPSGATIVNSGTATGFGAALTGSTNNTVTTVTAANAITGEAKLLFDPAKLTIGNASEEDTSIVFDGHAQDYYIGLDDTDDDFKIGLGSAAGTATHIVVDEAGIVTKPLQPAFKVTQTGALSVADAATLFSSNTTEVQDIGGNWASGTFTAPVAGWYYISASITYESIGAGDTDAIGDRFMFSNQEEYVSRYGKLNNAFSSGGYCASVGASISYMDANDTVYCNHNDGGTLAVHPTASVSHFEGYLLG